MINNKYYHDKQKGCDLKMVKFYPRNYNKVYSIRDINNKLIKDKNGNSINNRFKLINAYWCKTHQKLVCKCGWEFGRHNGEFNSKQPLRPKMESQTRICRECEREIDNYAQTYCDKCFNKIL